MRTRSEQVDQVVMIPRATTAPASMAEALDQAVIGAELARLGARAPVSEEIALRIQKIRLDGVPTPERPLALVLYVLGLDQAWDPTFCRTRENLVYLLTGVETVDLRGGETVGLDPGAVALVAAADQLLEAMVVAELLEVTRGTRRVFDLFRAQPECVG